MAKGCVFCGREFGGQRKNREHIISDWLVEEADLRKRTMTVNVGTRTFSAAMQRIVADACEDCNLSHATLEAHAKAAFTKLKVGQILDEPDGQALLDWLDKVRSGLWLWLLGASKGHYGIKPKFNIDARIGRKDRVALIARYPSDPSWRGLEFWGIGEQFLYMPTVMGLLINNIAIVSLSSDFLLARHLRDIVPVWHQSDNLLQSVDLRSSEDQHGARRLSILGLPEVIGQCIAPKDVIENDLQVDDVRESTRYATLRETSVMRLDSYLKPLGGGLGKVKEFSGNIDAHVILMEMNVSLASEFMLRDFLESDFSTVTNASKLKDNIYIYNSHLSAERIHMDELRAKYQATTGLALPP